MIFKSRITTSSFCWLLQVNRSLTEPHENGLQVKNMFLSCQFIFHSMGMILLAGIVTCVFVRYCRSLALSLTLMTIIYGWKAILLSHIVFSTHKHQCTKWGWWQLLLGLFIMQVINNVNELRPNGAQVDIHFLVWNKKVWGLHSCMFEYCGCSIEVIN